MRDVSDRPGDANGEQGRIIEQGDLRVLVDAMIRNDPSAYDFRKLPSLLDGTCPVCSGPSVKGWCAECVGVEALWDELVEPMSPHRRSLFEQFYMKPQEVWYGQAEADV